MKLFCSITTLILFSIMPLSSQDQGAPSEGVMGLLGLTPSQAYDRLGPPEEVMPFKAGDISWQVVHFHPTFVSLFYFQNHVWQVRLDKRYTLPFLDLKMGMTREQVTAVYGKAFGEGPDWLIYNLGFKVYPRRLRLVFEKNVLSDAYIFRGDF